MNCNGARGRKAEFEHLVDYLDPDIMILSETKLDNRINYTEFLPANFKGDIRKDRKLGGGGVMIAYRESLVVVEVEIAPVAAETVWARVELRSGRPTHIGAYYRAPSGRTTDSIDDLNKIIEDLPRDSPIILGGDFNAGDINWDTGTVA